MRSFLIRIWNARRAIAFYAVLLGVGWLIGKQLMHIAVPDMRPMNEPMIHRIVMIALVVFVFAAALPFVPGAEIGFALLLIFGGQASAIVYAGMVGALILSFTIARFVPLQVIVSAARFLRLEKFAHFLNDISNTPVEDRVQVLTNRFDRPLGMTLMRNRYVVLALLFNMPGNSVLGGGGGIAFIAGLSGLYRFWAYLLSVLIAVAPFPLLFLLNNG